MVFCVAPKYLKPRVMRHVVKTAGSMPCMAALPPTLLAALRLARVQPHSSSTGMQEGSGAPSGSGDAEAAGSGRWGAGIRLGWGRNGGLARGLAAEGSSAEGSKEEPGEGCSANICQQMGGRCTSAPQSGKQGRPSIPWLASCPRWQGMLGFLDRLSIVAARVLLKY